MHIVFITNEYPTKGLAHGGVGTMVKFLAQSFVKKGHYVSVVGIYKEGDNEALFNEGLKIYRIKTNGMLFSFYRNATSISNVLQSIHTERPIDIVDGPELTYAFIKSPKGVKQVIRMNGGHHFFAEAENRKREWRKVWIERRSFKKADHIIAVSDYVGKRTVELLNLNRKYTVINNPINVEEFHEADRLNINKDRLLFVGTIVEKKGIRQLIEAMPLIIEKHPNVELIVVGRDANLPGSQTPYRPILEKSIIEEIRPHIKFIGAVPHDEVVSYIRSAHVCVYPSHMEALPLAWLEVLGMGKAFVGSNTGPGTEVVTHGATGLLCNPHDPSDIAEKVSWMLDNKDEAEEMGKNARIDVLHRFDVKLIADKNIAFYKSIS